MEFEDGHLEVICGPMFSGKSEELIRRLRRVDIGGKKFFLFKPSIDDRYDSKHVVSHDNRRLEAHVVGTDRDSLNKMAGEIPEDVDVIAFDEANFFDQYVIDLTKKWISEGKRVIAAGLDMDFRGVPFGPVPELLAMADYVEKVKAICVKCKKRSGTITQRIVDGKPAKFDDPVIVVGAADKYEARCRKCHEVLHD